MRKPVFPRRQSECEQGKPHGKAKALKSGSFAVRDCAGNAAAGAESDASPATPRGLLAFQEIYRSRDGRMCLFADERTGHLAAVDSSRFA